MEPSSPLASRTGSRALDGAAAALPRSPQAVSGQPLPLQDQQTLSQLRRGNWSAIEELVHRYQDRLFTAMLRMVGHPEDAADLVQETFVRAIQHIGQFEGQATLYTWLFRIAINLALSHRRAAVYRRAAQLDGNADSAAPINRQAAGLHLAQRTEPDPALDAEARLDHEQLLRALAALDPDARAIIILRDIEECDYEQIGGILDIPVGTVKSRLFRARAALRERSRTSLAPIPHSERKP